MAGAAIVLYDEAKLTIVEFLPFLPQASSVLISETWNGSSVVTDFPVEEGASITDHVRPSGEVITLEVFVTNTPTTPDLLRGNGEKTTNRLPLKFQETIPNRQLDVSVKPSASTRRPGQLLSLLGNPKSASLGRTTTLQPLVLAYTLSFDQFDPVNDVNSLLKDFRSDAKVLSVFTSVDVVHNVVIVDLSRLRSSAEGSGARFSISFKKITTVTAQNVDAPQPIEPRAKPKVNKGSGNPKDKDGKPLTLEQSRSVLKGLFGT